MDGSDIKGFPAAHVPNAQLPVGKVINIKAILQCNRKIQTLLHVRKSYEFNLCTSKILNSKFKFKFKGDRF